MSRFYRAKLPQRVQEVHSPRDHTTATGNNRRQQLDLINGRCSICPTEFSAAGHDRGVRIHYDRPIKSHNYRTSVTSCPHRPGTLGIPGRRRVVDHRLGSPPGTTDLTNKRPSFTLRESARVEVVTSSTAPLPYDDNGPGSHVAGHQSAATGYDSQGEKTGIAPGANLVSLKVLDQKARTISNIIAALGWVAANASTYNIRVVNVSVALASWSPTGPTADARDQGADRQRHRGGRGRGHTWEEALASCVWRHTTRPATRLGC